MSEKSKFKKGKRLPAHIQYSVILWYFAVVIACSLAGAFLSEMMGDRVRDVMMFAFMFAAPVTGFVIGWWVKFHYAGQSDDETVKIRIKAQFWSTMAFVIAFVSSLLLILILLIMVESQSLFPENVIDPIAYLLSMLILVASLLIAYNTKKRVYRNFGL